MKTLLIATAAACSVLAVAANAQGTAPTPYRYCLEVRDATGPHPPLCRFVTLEQCMASKTSNSDACLVNVIEPPRR